MNREKITELRVGDRYAVINEGMQYSKEIIKIEKIDFNDRNYADCIVHFKTVQKIHGATQHTCRAWWIIDNCLLVSEETTN